MSDNTYNLNKNNWDFSGFAVTPKDSLDQMSKSLEIRKKPTSRSQSEPPPQIPQSSQPPLQKTVTVSKGPPVPQRLPPPVDVPQETEQGEDVEEDMGEEVEGEQEETTQDKLIRQCYGYRVKLSHLTKGVKWPGKGELEDLESLSVEELQKLLKRIKLVCALNSGDPLIHAHNAFAWGADHYSVPLSKGTLNFKGLEEAAWIETAQKDLKDGIRDSLIRLQLEYDFGIQSAAGTYFACMGGLMLQINRQNMMSSRMGQSPNPMIEASKGVDENVLSEFGDLIQR